MQEASRSDQTCSRRAFAQAAALAAGGILGLGTWSAQPAAAEERATASEEVVATADEYGVIEAGGFKLLPYTHYASGGVASDLYAVVLFENSNSTFTRYQVAYTSCTCRDAASNYRSVVYVELLNTKSTAAEASIRSISFSQNNDANVGLWGDSCPIHDRPEYDEAYMDEHLVQPLVGTTKADVDAWEGYGDFVSALDVDAIAGATVSTSNLTSLLQALFAYHARKYYGE